MLRNPSKARATVPVVKRVVDFVHFLFLGTRVGGSSSPTQRRLRWSRRDPLDKMTDEPGFRRPCPEWPEAGRFHLFHRVYLIRVLPRLSPPLKRMN
jgi:hypothetical protein